MLGILLLRCAARGNLDTLNMEFNKLNKEIGALRKVGLMRRRSLIGYGALGPLACTCQEMWFNCF